MGKVAVTFKIMPEGPETDMEKIKNQIKETFSEIVQSIEEKPIGFGLNSIEALFVLPDKGGTDEIEDKLKNIQGVANVETGDITLV
ncbi:elongation factor 1-beta [Candidatus Aenigmatarchaeota archaeon]